MKIRIIIAGIVTGLVVAGLLFFEIVMHEDQSPWYATEHVLDEFGDQGLTLIESNQLVTDTYVKGGITPTGYKVANTPAVLYLYEFGDLHEREAVFTDQIWPDISFVQDDIIKFNQARNILICLEYPRDLSKDEAVMIDAITSQVDHIVLFNLNHATQKVYQSTSPSWEGALTIAYYHYGFEEAGTWYDEGYYQMETKLKYLGDYQNITDMAYTQQTPTGSSGQSGEGSFLDANGVFERFSSGNSNVGVDKPDYQIEFSWDGYQEIVYLKDTMVTTF